MREIPPFLAKIIWKIFHFFAESCRLGSRESSKRVLMYIFTGVAIMMVHKQSEFSIGRYEKMSAQNKLNFEAVNLFPDIVWYMVFSVILGHAIINGMQKQPAVEAVEKKVDPKKVDPKKEEKEEIGEEN